MRYKIVEYSDGITRVYTPLENDYWKHTWSFNSMDEALREINAITNGKVERRIMREEIIDV